MARQEVWAKNGAIKKEKLDLNLQRKTSTSSLKVFMIECGKYRLNISQD